MKRLKKQVGIRIISKIHLSLLLTKLTKKGNKKNVVEEANTSPISEKKYRHSQQNREITNIKKTVPTSQKNSTHLTQ